MLSAQIARFIFESLDENKEFHYGWSPSSDYVSFSNSQSVSFSLIGMNKHTNRDIMVELLFDETHQRWKHKHCVISFVFTATKFVVKMKRRFKGIMEMEFQLYSAFSTFFVPDGRVGHAHVPSYISRTCFLSRWVFDGVSRRRKNRWGWCLFSQIPSKVKDSNSHKWHTKILLLFKNPPHFTKSPQLIKQY